ncbi:MAG: hypothetical protein NXH75_06235 [Halobacteriovoraceae bacterium]|nr:hypothetical protein [Halobacteriovoraceae bacterium]
MRYKIEGFEVQFEKPNGYQALRGYLGRDLVLLGPEKAKKRSTIFLEITNSNRISFEEEKKKKNEFKSIKTEWIKEKKAILNNFEIDKKLKYIKNEYLFHEVSYSMKGVKFIEGDLFYRCSPEVTANISFLVEEKRIMAFRGVFKRYMTSLACK